MKTFNQQEFNIQKKMGEEKPKQYKYEITLEDLPKNLYISVAKHSTEQINLEIKIRTKRLDWPFKNATLINDKSSDIKADDIEIMDFKKDEFNIINLFLNVNNVNEGNKTCIFYLNVNNKNYYDKKLVLNVVVEPEEVFKLRNEFYLSIEEYDTKKLLNALKKNKNDQVKAFGSLFQ